MTAPSVIKGKGLSIAPRQIVRVGHVHEPEFVADATDSAKISCSSEEGVIRRIEIKCGCGRIVTLICEYSETQ